MNFKQYLINEALSFEYNVPKDPEKVLYDFYLITTLCNKKVYKDASDFITPGDNTVADINFSLENAKTKVTLALRDIVSKSFEKHAGEYDKSFLYDYPDSVYTAIYKQYIKTKETNNIDKLVIELDRLLDLEHGHGSVLTYKHLFSTYALDFKYKASLAELYNKSSIKNDRIYRLVLKYKNLASVQHKSDDPNIFYKKATGRIEINIYGTKVPNEYKEYYKKADEILIQKKLPKNMMQEIFKYSLHKKFTDKYKEAGRISLSQIYVSLKSLEEPYKTQITNIIQNALAKNKLNNKDINNIILKNTYIHCIHDIDEYDDNY